LNGNDQPNESIKEESPFICTPKVPPFAPVSTVSKGHPSLVSLILLLFDLSFLCVVFLSHSSCVSPVELTDGRGEGASSYDSGKAWSSIKYKSFNTLDTA
jgi:hypothetical protein